MSMRNRVAGWRVLCAVVLIAAPAVADERTPPFEAQVSREEANIRAGSGVNNEVLATLPRGSHVSVIGEHAGWYRIRLPQSARCYVAAQYVDADGLVMGDHVNVRAGAGRQFSILGHVRRGDRLRVLEKQSAWARVEPPLILSGWMRADLVAPIAAAAAPPAGATTAVASASAAPAGTAQAPGATSGLTATTVAVLAVDASAATANLPPTATGMLELTRGFRQPSRHRLTEGGRTTFYLRGDGVDLARYQHQRVAVWGALDATVRSPHPLVTVQRIERAD